MYMSRNSKVSSAVPEFWVHYEKWKFFNCTADTRANSTFHIFFYDLALCRSSNLKSRMSPWKRAARKKSNNELFMTFIVISESFQTHWKASREKKRVEEENLSFSTPYYFLHHRSTGSHRAHNINSREIIHLSMEREGGGEVMASEEKHLKLRRIHK